MHDKTPESYFGRSHRGVDVVHKVYESSLRNHCPSPSSLLIRASVLGTMRSVISLVVGLLAATGSGAVANTIEKRQSPSRYVFAHYMVRMLRMLPYTVTHGCS
jgi:hypothetical protein